MTQTHLRIGALLLATLGLVSASFAQPFDREGRRGDWREGRGGAMRGGFEASGLKTGGAFPAIDIHDAEGKPFNTASLKGHFTVVVAGCLT